MQEYITNGRRVFRAILETWKFCPNTKIHLIIFLSNKCHQWKHKFENQTSWHNPTQRCADLILKP